MSAPDLAVTDAVGIAEPKPIVVHVPPYDTAPPARLPAVAPRTPVRPMLAPRKRASALDALRGLFLLSMTLGFAVMSPDLPGWMYHRQLAPGTGAVVDVPGISWRDLAYVSFLFTMAAALPLTLSRRIEHGEIELQIVGAAIKRFFLLVVFALLMAHSNTYELGYTQPARLVAIVGFIMMALLYTRRRPDWNEERYAAFRRAGWILLIPFLVLAPLAVDKQVTLGRRDDVIADLAFTSLVASLVWYVTRDRIRVRLGVLVGMVLLYAGAKTGTFGDGFLFASPIWPIEPFRLTLLTIAIPGTIAGDVVLRWMRAADTPDTDNDTGWSRGRLWGLVAVSAAVTPLVVVGLYQRQVALTALLALASTGAGLWLTRNPVTATERMLRSLFAWGALWLMIGLALEPVQGGIKKTPETLSYFFTVTGTTSLLLVSLTALIDGLRQTRATKILVDLGHNPLLMYVMFTVLLNSVFEMIPPLRPVLQGSPGTSIIRTLAMTAFTVVLVSWASRKRIYWRT
jgi:predicted acyltransferase